mmetsp:Transcript_78864/g.229044  ORF Transcript_78864/g.229044 Transcript_78864/m.229044 type:complete len:205 (+) Transcript_78864:505-1119(+)
MASRRDLGVGPLHRLWPGAATRSEISGLRADPHRPFLVREGAVSRVCRPCGGLHRGKIPERGHDEDGGVAVVIGPWEARHRCPMDSWPGVVLCMQDPQAHGHTGGDAAQHQYLVRCVLLHLAHAAVLCSPGLHVRRVDGPDLGLHGATSTGDGAGGCGRLHPPHKPRVPELPERLVAEGRAAPGGGRERSEASEGRRARGGRRA